MKKVFYYCNFPSPYYIGFLNELGKCCELTVVFERGASSERDDSWKQFSAPNIKNLIIMHGLHTKADMAFCPQIIRYATKEKYDHYIVHDPASPTGMWLIWYLKLRKIPFVFQCEGGFGGDGKSSLKEKYKKALMTGAKLYLSPMSNGREYFRAYGAVDDTLYRYPFASFYDKDILEKPLSAEEKKAIRAELGIPEKKVVVAVGQIIHRKAHDILIKAANKLPRDVGVYIIGGKANQELQTLLDDFGLTNVHFVEFIPKQTLWEYYKMADLLAVPTRMDTWGLFVNEAMANGLPVITTNRCAGGVELIENGENGYIIDVDDVDALAERIGQLLDDDALREKMAVQNVEKIQWYTFEQQAKVTLEALNTL